MSALTVGTVVHDFFVGLSTATERASSEFRA